MTIHLRRRGCLVLAMLAVSGCSSVSHLASPNMAPIIERFPFQADRPIARELRYTYMNTSVIDGQPAKKPLFSADPATRAQGRSAPPPAVVLAAASTPGPQVSDQLSRQADEMVKRGESPRRVEQVRANAVGQLQAEISLQRAQATANFVFAAAGMLSSLEVLAQGWNDTSADVLGKWFRQNTRVIGPEAPEGSVLQLDFIYVLRGQSWKLESQQDFLVHATLRDGRGRTLESKQGVQVYNFTGKSSTTMQVPADVFNLESGWAYAAKQPLLKDLIADSPFSVYLAFIACTALADLSRQAQAYPPSAEK